MNRNTIVDYLPLINHSIIVQEALLNYHCKADAMLKVLLKTNLPDYAASTLDHYLWGIHDNIFQAKHLNECLLKDLRKIAELVEPSKRNPKGDCHAYC